MSLIVDTIATATDLEPGHYLIDSSSNVGAGPFRSVEHASMYQQGNETISYFNGSSWASK